MEDSGWEHLRQLSAPAAWLVILGYTLQLYFDFSGYTDMALGLGGVFGLPLPENFDYPYIARSATEFPPPVPNSRPGTAPSRS